MRFSSSLVAFVYLGFAAAAAIPAVPASTPSVSVPSVVARAVDGLPANLGKLPAVPVPSNSGIPQVSGVPNKLPLGGRADQAGDILSSAGSLTGDKGKGGNGAKGGKGGNGGKGSKGGKGGKGTVRRDDVPKVEVPAAPVPSVPTGSILPSASGIVRRATDLPAPSALPSLPVRAL